jgi:hypothetical protein
MLVICGTPMLAVPCQQFVDSYVSYLWYSLCLAAPVSVTSFPGTLWGSQ